MIPSLREWHSKYKDQGLVVIGNHYPEFDYESDLDNLKEAVARNQIEYAVAQDNDGATWQAYNNRYWPTLYLIDKHGRLRYVHIGEGAYSETEAAIQSLLVEN
ncbi:MAG: redoxin domain-containing protein [Chloroflexota bacterium]